MISGLSAYAESFNRAIKVDGTKSVVFGVAARLASQWVSAGFPLPGVAPTTAAVPTRSTTGALGQSNGGSNELRLGRIHCDTNLDMTIMVADRLSHQGGLSGIVTTPQTTNLPTAPLTRYTSGEGVWIGLEIYTLIGTTATTVTASYTNSSGTAGRTTEPVVFGGTGFRETQRLITLPLQVGDVGVRSVASVTVLASTATAGNFGVTLFRPLITFPLLQSYSSVKVDAALNLGAALGEVLDDACLQLVSIVPSGISCNPSFRYEFVEDDA